MGPGEIIALIIGVCSLLIGGSGLLISQRNRRIDALEARNATLVTKLEYAEQTIETRQETIAELRRQLDRLVITAEIQERFFSGLPRTTPPQRGTND